MSWLAAAAPYDRTKLAKDRELGSGTERSEFMKKCFQREAPEAIVAKRAQWRRAPGPIVPHALRDGE